MRTKSILHLTLFLLLFTATAFAQNDADKEAKKHTVFMKSHLSLTPDQHKKVHQIYVDFYEDAIKNSDPEKSSSEKAKRIKELVEDREEKIKSVLSEEQFKKYMAIRKT
jgi:hypothetical protein